MVVFPSAIEVVWVDFVFFFQFFYLLNFPCTNVLVIDLVLFGCFARSVRMARLISIFEDWCDGRRLIIRDKVLHQTHIYLIYYPTLLIDAVHLTMNAIEI